MYEFEDWLRSEIHARHDQAIPAEQHELREAIDALPSDKSHRELRIQNELLERIIALENESIGLEAELERRNLPPEELAKHGGPGRD